MKTAGDVLAILGLLLVCWVILALSEAAIPSTMGVRRRSSHGQVVVAAQERTKKMMTA